MQYDKEINMGEKNQLNIDDLWDQIILAQSVEYSTNTQEVLGSNPGVRVCFCGMLPI